MTQRSWRLQARHLQAATPAARELRLHSSTSLSFLNQFLQIRSDTASISNALPRAQIRTLSPISSRPQIHQILNFIYDPFQKKGRFLTSRNQTVGLFCPQNPFHVQRSFWVLASAFIFHHVSSHLLNISFYIQFTPSALWG